MAIVWGATRSAGGASIQLGLDWSTATEATTQRVKAMAYVRLVSAGWVSTNYNKLTFTGSITGMISNISVYLSVRNQPVKLGEVQKTFTRPVGNAGTPITVAATWSEIPTGTATVTRSHTIPGTGYNAPATPSHLGAARSRDTRINMDWRVSSTSQAPITAFRIERRTNVGDYVRVATISNGATRAWADTGVSRNNYYRYRIRAEGPGGVSDWAYSAFVYTSPNAPGAVMASRDGDDVVVTWANQAHGAYETFVWYGNTMAGHANLSGALEPGVTSFRVSGLSKFENHVFTVGHSVPGDLFASTLSNTVRLASAPLAPTMLAPDGEDQPLGGSSVLSWRHNPTDGSTQTQYELQYRVDGGAWTTLAGTTDRERALPVSTAGTYEWQVRTTGQDQTKWSPWSDIASFNVVARPVAAFTTPIQGSTQTKASVTTTFTSNVSPVTWEVTAAWQGKTVTRNGMGSSPFTTTITGLPNGANVTLTLMVFTTVPSLPVTRTFTVSYAAPAQPSGEVEWGAGGAVNVYFVTGADESAMPTDSMRVYREENGELVLLAEGLPPDSMFTCYLPPLKGATYYVEAVSPDGVGTVSEPITVGKVPVPAHYLNWGPDFSRSIMLRYNPERDLVVGVGPVEQELAGRSRPRAVFGDLHYARQQLAGMLTDSDEATAEEQAMTLVYELGRNESPVAFRSIYGPMKVGYVTPPQVTELIWGGWQASLTHVEADHE